MLRPQPLALAAALLLAGGPGRGAPPEPEQHLCVIAPMVQANSGGVAQAVVALGNPTLFVAEPLEEVVIERQGQVLWRDNARPGEAIQGPQRWPLAPLQPGETVLLRLRPVGSGTDAMARLSLTGAPADQMRAAERLRNGLGHDPGAWRAAIERLLEAGELPLAWLLLFAVEGPSEPELDALRLQLFRRGCQDAPGRPDRSTATDTAARGVGLPA
ncbi:MAG: hypothetical protein ACKOPN_08720 [Prochlorococcaceae cyanobacterium]